MLEISKLVQEVTHLEFLPGCEHRMIESKYYAALTSGLSSPSKQPKKGSDKPLKIVFTLEKFNEGAFVANRRSNEILEHLFVYVRYVLDHTRKKFYDKLRFYEKLVNEIAPM